MQRLKGFSLIELVITLAVVAIMSSMVLTFSGAFLQDNRLATANNDLVGSINLARSTAVSRGETASICASSNGTSCTSTAWEQGWIVFSDTGTAGVIDGADQILKVSNKVGVNVTVNSPSFYLQFKPQGYVASTCVNCYDKTVNQRFDSVFAAVINNLLPISLAQASESDDSGNSGSTSDDSSDDDGSSGSSNSSSTSSAPTLSCVAPASTNSSSGSGSSNDDSESDDSGSSSASYNVQKYTDFAFNFLDQISPISSAQASESDDSDDSGNSGSSSDDSASDDSGDSGSSGSSSNNTNTGAKATCDDGTGAGQQPLSKSDFLICDGSKSAERGSRISVSAVGRVSRSRAICN